jgi:RNA binding exosome subunit
MAEQRELHVDDPMIQMIRDRFSNVDRDNQEMLTCLKEHIKKDEEYWRKIDDQQAQIGVVKWLAGTGILGAVANWFYQTFKH